ncbi:alpha-ketoglutarate-dependent dioxygenase AlkB family protein [Pedobacter nyackensis]|uniref:Alkylated DNA repair dioxygenase AlkB n=1 Tax=Pedobacter nyackensis TaxID=475255 RepID=A0A1W2ACB1_9SPHI|nr:alpha-ketoglutarate-dependent dioxygenase AlkB [Pedobacter nyackensis]SMC58122.1 Alkylated DNA repair dioxygenase AlkB [Pedobacter nyackensis]
MDKSLYLDHTNLLPIPGEVFFYPDFFDAKESDEHFRYLKSAVDWKQDSIRMAGKEVLQPRLTAFYGEKGVSYNSMGFVMKALPWIDVLQSIKQDIEGKFDVKFNSCQLSHYRDGSDYIGWHRDNKKSLGQYPFIASVSFGASRIFQFRHYADKIPIISIELTHRSLLIMKAETQHLWEHRLPKTILPIGPRINLTFRHIIK